MSNEGSTRGREYPQEVRKTRRVSASQVWNTLTLALIRVFGLLIAGAVAAAILGYSVMPFVMYAYATSIFCIATSVMANIPEDHRG